MIWNMGMREQREDEDRVEYLAKVLYKFMNKTNAGSESMVFDGVECDGFCLAEDMLAAVGVYTDEIDD